MKNMSRFVIIVLVSIGVLLAALPAFAAQDATLLSYSLNEAECYVDVTFQVEDAGFYAVNMWDDGNFRAGAGTDVPAGGTAVVRFTIGGVILQGATGIGVYVENAAGPTATATYDSDGSAQLWSDSVATACVDAGVVFSASVVVGTSGCTYPLPSGSAVYNVPAGALAFYAPDASTYTGFNLSPGTWYISEFTDDYAKVWIACEAQPIYIPIDNVIR